jgi:hypothetical protein
MFCKFPQGLNIASIVSQKYVIIVRMKSNNGLFVAYFTFMLPCIVIDFFLNNQPDALNASDTFSAHHQEFATVHSALVSFMQV